MTEQQEKLPEPVETVFETEFWRITVRREVYEADRFIFGGKRVWEGESVSIQIKRGGGALTGFVTDARDSWRARNRLSMEEEVFIVASERPYEVYKE